ncbi:hypothetical protein QAD02_012196 [Eretmocerus hayati]|uniref:Uncharacterized protein n=1 Tax=Eretmocerus hayati TaxID=131215 RepID=A0ACC2NZ91_9HYME|nr:hypothetical protein QAD02_012196 [Eretmocerus hayati]
MPFRGLERLDTLDSTSAAASIPRLIFKYHHLTLGKERKGTKRHITTKYTPKHNPPMIQRLRLATHETLSQDDRRRVVYDASAKIPPGIINGNIQQLGNYDECLRIKTGQDFVAQACSASVQFEILRGPKKSRELDMKDLLIQVAKASELNFVPDHSVDYEWMWCVPSTCNHSEISEALELALDPLKVDGRLDFTVSVTANSCHTIATDKNSFDITDWFYIGVLLLFLGILVASTMYDLHLRRSKENSSIRGTKNELLTSFSLSSNGKELLSTKRHRGTIKCLDGLRYLSICWIIYGHTFYLEAVGVKMDRSSIPKMHENWASMFILNGNIATDVFFLISGLLLSYTSLCKSSKSLNASFNIFLLFLNRYLRLTPAYAIMIGFYATLFDKLGSGPRWNIWVHSSKMSCRENWWTNILYINNYVNVDNVCMSQSWYLSVDMQLLLISPIFLYPLLKYNRTIFFWLITSAGILASILVPFFITYLFHLTGTMLYYKNLQDVTNVYLKIYTRVYTRAGPYIIGLALGYVMFKTRGYEVQIRSIYMWCGWLISITAAISVIFAPREMYFDDHIYNKYEASFYAGLHRHIFALAVSWVVFACDNGYAGILSPFLSWTGWVPLSKLTYSAYLTHYVVLLYGAGSARTSTSLSAFGQVQTFFGNLCLTMLLSLCLSCCFEMPFMRLTRLLLGSRSVPESELGGSGSKLPTSSAELIFGSTDSAEGCIIGPASSDSCIVSSDSVNSVFVISGEAVVHQTEKKTTNSTSEIMTDGSNKDAYV